MRRQSWSTHTTRGLWASSPLMVNKSNPLSAAVAPVMY